MRDEIETFAVDGGEWFDAGGGGTPIQEGICVAQLRSADGRKGLSIAAFDDPEIVRLERLLPGGEWKAVEVIENEPSRIAMLDEANANEARTQIRGFDAAGHRIDCMRSG